MSKQLLKRRKIPEKIINTSYICKKKILKMSKGSKQSAKLLFPSKNLPQHENIKRNLA